jgi:hypothetical protein
VRFTQVKAAAGSRARAHGGAGAKEADDGSGGGGGGGGGAVARQWVGRWKNLGFVNRTHKRVAPVDRGVLLRFMRAVFPTDPCELPDWQRVFSEYNAYLGAQALPRTFENMTVLGEGFVRPPWLRQYRTPPWCTDRARIWSRAEGAA